MARKKCDCGCNKLIPRNVIDRALEVGVLPRWYDARCCGRWHQRERRKAVKAKGEAPALDAVPAPLEFQEVGQ